MKGFVLRLLRVEGRDTTILQIVPGCSGIKSHPISHVLQPVSPISHYSLVLESESTSHKEITQC